MTRVALAFSGGLDTTVCVPLLEEEYGYDEVIGVTVDVGQPAEEFDEAEETAEALDLEHYVVDAKEEFADLCFDSVRANATYQGYPLGRHSLAPSSRKRFSRSPKNRTVLALPTAVRAKVTTNFVSRPSGATPIWKSSRPCVNSASPASGNRSTPTSATYQ